MLLYQGTGRFFAAVAPGVEALAVAELIALGADQVRPAHRGVHFVATEEQLWRIVYCARLPSRILAPLSSFACHSAKYLHRRASELPWENLLSADSSLAVSATVANSRMRHSQHAALTVKDAVCDRFRARTGRRPDVDRRDPDLRVHVHVQGNKATVSVDCGAGAMHRRGYRTSTGEAPMQETLAAAVLAHAGWAGECALIDPMCGSGTLLAEALMRACGIPASHLRDRFGFERLPGFDPARWRRVRASIDGAIRTGAASGISGSDVDREMVAAARENLGHLPGGSEVGLSVRDLRDHPGLRDGVVVCNPPYGIRLGDGARMPELMRALGDFLKQRCKGSRAWIYLGNRSLLKQIGLRPTQRIPLRSGPLDGRLAHFELY